MAYPYRRRRPIRKRRVVTRRKRMMRRTRVPRLIRSRQPVHNFKRTLIDTSTYYISNVALALGTTFKLNQLPNYTEFTALFDQYRICKIKFQLIPSFGAMTISGTAFQSGLLGSMYTALDYNDVTAPADINTLLEYQNMKHTRQTRTHTRYFTPAVPMVETTPDSSTLTNSKWSPWIATSQANTAHYGVKLFAEAEPSVNSGTYPLRYQAHITFYIQCKNVK